VLEIAKVLYEQKNDFCEQISFYHYKKKNGRDKREAPLLSRKV
jgi:hypothetical protein